MKPSKWAFPFVAKNRQYSPMVGQNVDADPKLHTAFNPTVPWTDWIIPPTIQNVASNVIQDFEQKLRS